MSPAPQLAAIATHAGLRGRPGIELTTPVITDAVARLADDGRRQGLPPLLALARDSRPPSARLAALVAETASAGGVDVIDLGVASTPAAKLAATARGAAMAIVVTASHLGPEWAGLKLLAGAPLLPVDLRTLPPAERRLPRQRGRVVASAGAAREHADAISAAYDLGGIAGLRVGLRGGTGRSTRVTLAALGVVLDASSALTLCVDADGDRLALVDEDGIELDTEATFALACAALRPGVIVRGADTSRMVDRICGVSAYIARPGELHLIRELQAHGAEIAGEGNGGVVLPRVGLARDALATAAVLLAYVAAVSRPLSALAAELPQLSRERSVAPCPTRAEAHASLERAASRLQVGYSDPEEGVFVEHQAGAWGLIRLSATEPVLRFTAEAEGLAVTKELHLRLRAAAGYAL